MRKTVVSLLFLLVVVISSTVFLLPSYILTTFRENETKDQLKTLENLANKNNRPEVIKGLDDINKKISSVKIGDDFAYYDLLQKILSEKPQSVHVASIITQEKIDKDKTVHTVQLNGISDTRDDLVNYKSVLDASGKYKEVYLPISSLASETDVEFVMNIETI